MRTTVAVGLASLLVACDAPGASPRAEGTELFDCGNGSDEDGDGRVDCDDPGCAGSAECSPLPPLTTGIAETTAPADLTCLGVRREPARGSEIDVTLELREITTGVAARNVRIWVFPDDVIRDSCTAGLCSEVTTDTELGAAAVRLPSSGWFAYRTLLHEGPTLATSFVDTVHLHVPAPSTASTFTVPVVSRGTTDVVIVELGPYPAPGTTFVMGHALDCAGAPIRGAVVRAFTSDGEIVEGDDILREPGFGYYNGAGSPDGYAEFTSVDGIFFIANAPSGATPLRLELWARPSESDPETRIACEVVSRPADVASVVDLGPLRGDYPDGHPCRP